MPDLRSNSIPCARTASILLRWLVRGGPAMIVTLAIESSSRFAKTVAAKREHGDDRVMYDAVQQIFERAAREGKAKRV